MPKRVFIGFAKEDERSRDFLVQQAKDERSPFEFVDMSVKEPWSSEWYALSRGVAVVHINPLTREVMTLQ